MVYYLHEKEINWRATSRAVSSTRDMWLFSRQIVNNNGTDNRFYLFCLEPGPY